MQTRVDKYRLYREELENEKVNHPSIENKKVVMDDKVSFSSIDDSASLTSTLPLTEVMSILNSKDQDKETKKKLRKILIKKILIYSLIFIILILLIIAVIFLGIYAFN
ncbi:MAG: hypothetical protein ACI31G_02655 [Bacilli bacterium]